MATTKAGYIPMYKKLLGSVLVLTLVPLGVITYTMLRQLQVDGLTPRATHPREFFFVLIVALTSCALALMISRRVVLRNQGRAERLATAVEAAARGEYNLPLDIDGSDELAQVARAVAGMRRALQEQIANIERAKLDLQTILDTIPDTVMALDAEQRILLTNPTFFRLFDLPKQKINGQKLWEVLRHPGLQEAVAATFANRWPHSAEFEIIHPPRVVAFRGRTLNLRSGQGIIIVLHDMTELRRLERIRQEFFANVSHELKTPLASIKAYTETLLDHAIEDQVTRSRFLKRIEEQADRLNMLVIDMLLLARAESRDHGFDIRVVDLVDATNTSLDFFRDKADHKRICLNTDIPRETRFLLADAEGLMTILRNLIDNAIKYTPESGIVKVSARLDGDRVAVSVEDTGVGIPQEDLGRVFERFYRVDKARSRELGGTGLGLSIVKHLAQAFGGEVGVTSRLDHGSRFTVTLPAGQEPSEVTARKVVAGA